MDPNPTAVLPGYSAVPEKSVYNKILWHVSPIFFVCFLIAYLDRVNIGFAKLQMLGDVGLSNTAYAIGASIFFWGYVLLEIPSNLILRHVGARKWITRIMITWGFTSSLMAFIVPLGHTLHLSTETTFYLLRFLLGMCEAGLAPGFIVYLSSWFPASKMSKVIASYLVAMPLSMLFGGPLSGWILQHAQNMLGYHGWQWMFLIEGLPAVVMGILVFFFLEENIQTARWLTPEEKNQVSGAVSREDAAKTGNFGNALKDIRVWLMVGILLMMNTGFYGLSFWLPSIIKEAGIGNTFYIGLMSALPWVPALPAMFGNAAHSNRTRERRLHAAVPALISGIAFMLSAACGSNVWLSLLFLTISASGILAMIPIFWTFPTQILSGTAAAAGVAMVNSIGSLGGITGAMVTNIAQSITGNVNSGTYVFGLCLMLSAGLILCLPVALFYKSESE